MAAERPKGISCCGGTSELGQHRTDRAFGDLLWTCATRLSAHDRLAIRETAAEVAGSDARVYLFGSRTRDDLRGGDIDLLAELATPRSVGERLQVSVRTAARLQRLIDERKIDVLVADPLTPAPPLLCAAGEQATAL